MIIKLSGKILNKDLVNLNDYIDLEVNVDNIDSILFEKCNGKFESFEDIRERIEYELEDNYSNSDDIIEELESEIFFLKRDNKELRENLELEKGRLKNE